MPRGQFSEEVARERSRKISESLTGKKLTKEHKAKLSAWHKGKSLSEQHKLNIGRAGKGRLVSDDTRRRQSLSLQGRKPAPQTIAAIRLALIGKKLTPEQRIRKSQSCKKGEAHHNWMGGKSSKNAKDRASVEARLWRESVFQRDGYICQHCLVHGGDLHAHHVKPFALYPELRTAISNGLTLCVKCHRHEHVRLKNIRPAC